MTATGAAAETPHFSSSFLTRSAASITVDLLSSSTRFAISGHITIFFSFRLVVIRGLSSHKLWRARHGILSSRPANRRFTLFFLFGFPTAAPSLRRRNLKFIFAFSELALKTWASCYAGVLINRASLVCGAMNSPRSLPRKTSRVGKSASASIAASSSRWLFK